MKRDPKRIDRILSLVERYWHQHPDLRFVQMVVNWIQPKIDTGYYLEDNTLEEALREALKNK